VQLTPINCTCDMRPAQPARKEAGAQARLDIPFAELVERLMQTEPNEVEESIEKAK
jgi:hypothetical protein